MKFKLKDSTSSCFKFFSSAFGPRSSVFKIVFFHIFPALLSARLCASTNASGTTSTQFLKIGPGARAITMGEAYVAVDDDQTALYYNPAGLWQAESGLQAGHNIWFGGASSEHLLGSARLNGFALGASFNYLLLPSQDITLRIAADPNNPYNNFQTIGSFTPFEAYAALGASYPVLKNLQAGLALKITMEKVQNQSGMNIGLNAGTLYKLNSEWKLGLVLQNIGAPGAIFQQAFALPLLLRAGAAYSPFQNHLHLSAEADLPIDNQFAFAIGLEDNLNDVLYPRLGYRVDGIFNPWSAGLGFRISQMMLDLGVQSAAELGLSYRVSLSYLFGPAAPVLAQPTPAPVPESPAQAPKFRLSQLDAKTLPDNRGILISLQMSKPGWATLAVFKGQTLPPDSYQFGIRAKAGGQTQVRYSAFNTQPAEDLR